MSNFFYVYTTEDHEGTPVDLLCELEYEEPEIGSRQNGLQMEPDYPASVTLVNAKIENISVYFLLSDKLIEDIEREALSKTEQTWYDYED